MSLVREAQALLADHSTMTLAVTDGDGPWAAAVYFVADGLRPCWLSDPAARHSRAIELDGRVAATVHGETWGMEEIRGLQITGRAGEVTDRAERRRVRELYIEKFRFVEPLLARIRGVRWFRLEPTRIVSIDNARGFGDRRDVPIRENSPDP